MHCLESRLHGSLPLLCLQGQAGAVSDWHVKLIVNDLPRGTSVLYLWRVLIRQPILIHQVLPPPRFRPFAPRVGTWNELPHGLGSIPACFLVLRILTGNSQRESVSMGVGSATYCCNERLPADDFPSRPTETPRRHAEKGAAAAHGLPVGLP